MKPRRTQRWQGRLDGLEPLESRWLLAAEVWHNFDLPADVDGNGSVFPADVLWQVDNLNRQGFRILPETMTESPPVYLDVNRDGQFSPADILMVVDTINRGAHQPTPAVPVGQPVAHWTFDDPGAPYADQRGNAISLDLDANTAAPKNVGGAIAGAIALNWQASPGVSTRLTTYHPAVQTNSFGFSFWLAPDSLSPGDNLIGKEMQATSDGPEFTRVAWKLHVGQDDGSGAAPLELVVRGDARTQGDYFGSVLSSMKVPLHRSSDWLHIAGGYEATTGQLSIYVNDVGNSATGRAGATSSDGGAFVIGSMVNGTSAVAPAVLARIDEVRLFDHPLPPSSIASLHDNPRRDARPVAAWNLDGTGAPYSGREISQIQLSWDSNTSAAQTVEGFAGNAAQLSWQSQPGIGTRLATYDAAVQQDSFGFSFWLNPTNLAAGENLIGKEMHATRVRADYTRLAWQVHFGNDDGSGTALLELLVRGSDRSQGDFFGSVLSTTRFALHRDTDAWCHIAGGYDAVTGELRLFVNGIETTSVGRAGANNSDGGAFVVGSMVNGMGFVAQAAMAALDEIQISDAPLTGNSVASLLSHPSRAARLLADWKLDESGSPFSDQSGNATPLNLDFNTATPRSTVGPVGGAVELIWQSPPGVSTRLTSYNAALQCDSFGFSFWFDPRNLSPGENLIGKEMLATNVGPDFSRVAWQVHLGGDDGTGSAPLELLVRGADRMQGDYFGGVFSAINVPLGHDSDAWFHVAGGYDATTGKLSLSVNGSEATADGRPGAYNSDGGALVVGTMVNGSTFVAHAAMAAFDEVRIFDRPLTTANVADLRKQPGRPIEARTPVSAPSTLVAHWKLNEPGPWYGDWSGNENNLNFDQSTSAPEKTPGIESEALRLKWQADTGIATRLYASGDALQSDDFGFSFWTSPTRLAPGESFLAKESPPGDGPSYTRVSWSVRVGDDNGAGLAPFELVVRGSDQSQGDFFGTVRSSAVLPLYSDESGWTHVAGGYDSATGALTLFVNGVANSESGRPGANNSDGGWISIGSVRNGIDFVTIGAICEIDDVQLYDGPLSDYDVAILRNFAGRQVNPLTQMRTPLTSLAANGDLIVTFNSVDGWYYRVEASTEQVTWKPLQIVTGVGNATMAAIPESALDELFGEVPRNHLSVRIQPLLADTASATVGLPSAEIVPFPNPEEYVPQYHFSLPGAAVGDPNGVIRYQNDYHIFTWDHAASDDLVTWTNLGWPMRDIPADSGFWTGSVVVDKNNTSGFGSLEQPPMVAIYTIHNNSTNKETIGISYSTNYRDFYQYVGNPVLQTDDLVFRDPDVFWDQQTNRWIMLVARSEAHDIQFYASSDLKSWQYQSSFSGMGAQAEIWEVPGLVEVPVRGMGKQSKWVLYVGAGTNKVQYFVGDFDGTRFTLDDATRNFLENGTGLAGEVFADFERDNYWDAGWTYTGEAFGNEPAPDWWNGVAQGYLGQRLASSHVRGDWLTASTLTSRTFTVTQNAINFLIAGGNHPGQTCINLVVDGQVVRSTTGDDSDQLRWAGWDVREFIGRQAQIQIVDDYGGFWGRIYVDQIMFSDILTNDRREHANWVDFGSDFFAPRVVRDYDGVQQGATWLGWIGNWQYEASRPDPATWGKGAESIFRNLALQPAPQGYRLTQTPIAALQKLRGPVTNVSPRELQDLSPLADFQPQTNTYELEAVFNLKDAGQKFGLNLAVSGAPQRVVVGYDTATSNLFLDRTSSGYVTFGPGFQSVVTAPYKPSGEELKLHIFVDQSSIEVFVNDGQRAFTSQIYPDPSGTAIELFSYGGATTLQRLTAWPLASIWNYAAPGLNGPLAKQDSDGWEAIASGFALPATAKPEALAAEPRHAATDRAITELSRQIDDWGLSDATSHTVLEARPDTLQIGQPANASPATEEEAVDGMLQLELW